VDLLEGVKVGDGDFCGRDAHDGAILFVEGVDVKDARAGYDGAFEAELREVRVPGAGEGVEGRGCGGEEALGGVSDRKIEAEGRLPGGGYMKGQGEVQQLLLSGR